jgi:hypothetical protein
MLLLTYSDHTTVGLELLYLFDRIACERQSSDLANKTIYLRSCCPYLSPVFFLRRRWFLKKKSGRELLYFLATSSILFEGAAQPFHFHSL